MPKDKIKEEIPRVRISNNTPKIKSGKRAPIKKKESTKINNNNNKLKKNKKKFLEQEYCNKISWTESLLIYY